MIRSVVVLIALSFSSSAFAADISKSCEAKAMEAVSKKLKLSKHEGAPTQVEPADEAGFEAPKGFNYMVEYSIDEECISGAWVKITAPSGACTIEKIQDVGQRDCG